MKRSLTLFLFCSLCPSSWTSNNLGTILTVQKGLATIKECGGDAQTGSPASDPIVGLPELRDILNFTTTNQCLASAASFQNAGIDIPQCPDSLDDLKGLDNTYPTGGIFAIYTGDNRNFLYDFSSTYLKSNPLGRFNLVLPVDMVSQLQNDSELLEVLNSPRVNIVDVAVMETVQQWMQDSLQFTSLGGKPAIYQLAHHHEAGLPLENRLACQIARQCGLPYFIPPGLLDPANASGRRVDAGGNLEVLPGGTFIMGLKADFRNFLYQHRLTTVQKIYKSSLEESGNRVLELDTNFLRVGHVDEIVNVIKTNRPPPCDYAIMLASPEKAFELMEKTATDAKLPPLANGSDSRCNEYSFYNLRDEGNNTIIRDDRVEEIYNQYCVNGVPFESYFNSEEYHILKNQNLSFSSGRGISLLMEGNRKKIVDELKSTTKCDNPQIIELPVFFRSRISYLPNLVNSVVETPSSGEASKVILPRTYFKPFDDYTKDELKKYGVNATLIHDLEYHLRDGEIHCGTNEARICR